MNSASVQPLLLSLAVLSAAVSLASCAPAASSSIANTSAASSATSPTGTPARATNVTPPRYAPQAGQVWTISGVDQNNNTLRSKITLAATPPTYHGGRDWDYVGDTGYINLYEVERGTRFVVWDVSDPQRLMACYIRQSYSDTQHTYEGIGLAGSAEEIGELFAKLSTVYGGGCRVTRN